MHGIVEILYRRYREQGVTAEEAFRRSAESVTGPISRVISQGSSASTDGLDEPSARGLRDRRTRGAYPPRVPLIEEIYDEVASGNEIRSVVQAGKRLERFPMGKIDGTRCGGSGQKVRARPRRSARPRSTRSPPACSAASMMAQIDLLLAHGHPYSEIANESVIEAVDSLNPYMHARGVAYMVDNCSVADHHGSRFVRRGRLVPSGPAGG